VDWIQDLFPRVRLCQQLAGRCNARGALVAALCFSPVVLLKELCKALGSIWKKKKGTSIAVKFKYFYKEVFNSR